MDGARSSAGAPLSVSAILTDAFELYRRQARGAWAIVVLIALPAQVLVWIMIRVSLSGNVRVAHGSVYASSTAIPTVAITLLGFLSGVLAIGALTRLCVETYAGQRTSWQDSLAFASANFAPLLGLAVVFVLGLTIGYAFVIPGVFLTVAWSASVPALMVERVGPMLALRRSWELVRGYWWTIFGAIVIALLIIVGISFLVDAVLTDAQSSSSIDVILALQGFARAIGAILTYPFLAAVAVVIYAGLRAQKDGVRPTSLMPRAM
ncbi:MAG TPA: hypothetical protein VGF70_10060 [Solirubrobacteraceae bacterium]|jgi:hypothetical protein